MQKDIHFYLTFALARNLGISKDKSEKIAWANQFTDDLTYPELHGIQTQSEVVGNWMHRQIQLSVLVPFHFIPGSDKNHPWMTTRNSRRARRLVRAALKSVPFQFGIALHVLQDTFSHENFSGWDEPLNACFPWYYIEAAIPNVGHAEMRAIPDVVNYVWTDPRTGRRIDNRRRALSAAKATYDFLAKVPGATPNSSQWEKLEDGLKAIFKLESYDQRKDELRKLSGQAGIDYDKVSKRLQKTCKDDFIQSASSHLSEAMKLMRDLPWGP